MKLFEATNGFTGESYVRVYVWCETIEQAKNLARATFEKYALNNNTISPKIKYFSNIQVVEIFDGASTGFVTMPSDSGFNFNDAIREPFINEV